MLLTQEGIYGCLETDKDCVNHVHKWRGAFLRTLVHKKEEKRLTRDKINKTTMDTH